MIGKRKVNTKGFGRAWFCMLFWAVMMFFSSVGLVFCWYISMTQVTHNSFDTGRLRPQLQAFYWEKTLEGSDKWCQLLTNVGQLSFCPHLGEITDITRLPDDCTAYLRLRVSEENVASYKYDILLNNITILVYSKKDNQQIELDEGVLAYYSASPSQKCLDYSVVCSVSPTLSPSNIDLAAKNQLLTPSLSLTDSLLVYHEYWLYLRLELRLSELQNIFKSIKASYMPYTLQLNIEIIGEARTLE